MDNRKMIITIIIVIMVALLLFAIYNYWKNNRNLPDYDCTKQKNTVNIDSCKDIKNTCGTDQKCLNAVSACMPVLADFNTSMDNYCKNGLADADCDLDKIIDAVHNSDFEECKTRMTKVDPTLQQEILKKLGVPSPGKISKSSVPHAQKFFKNLNDDLENSLPQLYDYLISSNHPTS